MQNAPADLPPSRGAAFLVFDRLLNAAVKRGSSACPKAMHRIADTLRSDRNTAVIARLSVPGVTEAERRAAGFLKARCGLCQSKCDNPVI